MEKGAQNQENGRGKGKPHPLDGGTNDSLSHGVRNWEGESRLEVAEGQRGQEERTNAAGVSETRCAPRAVLADGTVQAGCLGDPFGVTPSPVNHAPALGDDLTNRGARRWPCLEPACVGPFFRPSTFPEGFQV